MEKFISPVFKGMYVDDEIGRRQDSKGYQDFSSNSVIFTIHINVIHKSLKFNVL